MLNPKLIQESLDWKVSLSIHPILEPPNPEILLACVLKPPNGVTI